MFGEDFSALLGSSRPGQARIVTDWERNLFGEKDWHNMFDVRKTLSVSCDMELGN